jgi:hypothetical protein
MNLTPEIKAVIDNKDVRELLHGVRYCPIGDEMFQGETGEYWLARLAELRNQNQGAYVQASKTIGWESA